ncbi:MAG: hypothetical protein JWP75_1448 [Frondihabitans sp.]|nr:hypothetical protein [Frondihabitans sp.]
MPREVVLLTPEMPGDESFRAAALRMAPTVGGISLALDAGGLLARFHSPDLDPLLTVLHPRRIRSLDEIDRLLPAHGALPPMPAPGYWWTDAVVPWGAALTPGLALARALAEELAGVLVDRAAA